MCNMAIKLTTTRLTPSMRVLEKQLGRPLREVLIDDYGDRPHDEVAEALGISERTLERWMERLGLHRQSVIVAAHDGEGDTPSNGRGETHTPEAAALEGSPRGARTGA